MRIVFPAVAVMFLVAVAMPSYASAQRRDYFTDDEIELIRDAQEIDRRIDVLVHCVDRRFEALGIAAGAPAEKKKDDSKWGPIPARTRLDLFSDIKRILQKAIDDIDNLAEFPDSAIVPDKDEKRKKTPKELFDGAFRSLADAAARWEPVLDGELDRSKDEREKGLLLDSIESCRLIKAASAKVPAQPAKK